MSKIQDVEDAIANFERQVMKNTKTPMLRLGSEKPNVEVIPFGVPAWSPEVRSLDEASGGIGGIPRGRSIELYGPESSGKSWLAMKLVASAQKMGLKAAWLDPEFSFVPSWAAQQGVDISKLVLGDDFENGEHCLEYMLAMCRTKFADIVVLDSVAALIPRAELEHKLDEVTIGATGRMMSLAVKQIVQASADHKVTTIFINQTRDKVGVMFGNPETTPGGKALKFYCSMRIRAERYKVEQQEIDGKKTPIRALSKVRFIKNKVGLPFLDGEFEIRFDNLSVNPLMMLLRKAVEYRVIRKQKIDDEQQFVWWVGSTGKEAIPTNCSDMSELVDWVSVSEPDVPKKIAEMVIAKAVEKQEENTLDAVIKAYANGEQVSAPDVPKGEVVEEKA